ncbi:unnamed protein product [Caenorhabditis brenneri]
MTRSFLKCLLFVVFVLESFGQLSRYASWTPEQIRYCETVANPADQLAGGITCGSSSFTAMRAFFNTEITSTVSLGLISVKWITSEALRNQSGFWNTCKPYMVRLFDGIYANSTAACALMTNPPSGMPNCTQDYGSNFHYRSGSGYCMKSKVCGASVNIDFLKSADDKSLLWSWIPATTDALVSNGFIKVGVCYGYDQKDNGGRTDVNLIAGDANS